MSDSDSLPLVSESDCAPVPVFNCIIILDKSGGRVAGRVANLSGISIDGNNERDVLTALTKKFKQTVMALSAEQNTIPWIDPPEKPQAHEVERFIPVHL